MPCLPRNNRSHLTFRRWQKSHDTRSNPRFSAIGDYLKETSVKSVSSTRREDGGGSAGLEREYRGRKSSAAITLPNSTSGGDKGNRTHETRQGSVGTLLSMRDPESFCPCILLLEQNYFLQRLAKQGGVPIIPGDYAEVSRALFRKLLGRSKRGAFFRAIQVLISPIHN